MATFQLVEGHNLNFAIPAESLWKLKPSKGESFAQWVAGAYWEALAFTDRKEYRAAIAALKNFLTKQPNSPYADNAQFLIGECYDALGGIHTDNLVHAIIEFDHVRRRYPNSEKAPAALFMQALAFADLGEKTNASLLLQDLTERYPRSPEASMATKKLLEWGGTPRR